VDRQTACGNPFPMGADGRDERLRDAVCFAFDEFLKDPIACVGPVTHTADLMHEGERTHPVFRLGAVPMASMVGLRAVTYAYSTVGYWLQRDAGHQRLLRDALLASDDPLLEGWAERIRPPPQELLDLVQVRLPDMLAVDLLALPFAPVYAPAVTAYLPRMPAQLPAVPPHCVRSAMELLTPQARVRVHTWLGKALAQLHCIELKQPNCELLRPQAIALGQAAMLPWARGRIWDLTFERSACAVPLDVTLPNESNLDLAFLRRRLEGYPDQNLVANILDGIRFEADVELQTILVPHLISLPKGFESVRKGRTVGSAGLRSGFDSGSRATLPPLVAHLEAHVVRRDPYLRAS
jgi:hypothetical protein